MQNTPVAEKTGSDYDIIIIFNVFGLFYESKLMLCQHYLRSLVNMNNKYI